MCSPVRGSVLTLSALVLAAMPLKAQAKEDALAHAKRLLDASILIDGHNDLPWEIRTAKDAPMDVAAYDLRKTTPGHTDFARLAEGKLSAQFWSIYIPGEIKDSGYARVQLEQFDIARRMIAMYPDKFSFALTADDIVKAKKQKKIASLLGMEGGHAIENSLGALRVYYDLGARYMTLTHNVTLDWADAAAGPPTHGGLTAFGKEVVREMNRLGMLVDLSHVAPSVMSDAITVSEAPVIFSHSSARALTDHARNVPDSILARLPKNGGVVMVTFVPGFVSQEILTWDRDRSTAFATLLKDVTDTTERRRIVREYNQAHPAPRATLAQVADHIEHIRKVAGIDHVGIGGDYDGVEDLPVGLESVAAYPALFAELIRRGWSDADLKKLAGENTLRALRGAEATAKRLRSRAPSTATITQLDGKANATN